MLAGDGDEVGRGPHPSHVLGQDPHVPEGTEGARFTTLPRTDRPRLALFDWDNTLHRGWTLEGWIEHLIDHGIVTREREPVWAERTHRYATGQIDHNQLAEEANGEYARALAGWSRDEAIPLVRRFVADTDHRQVYGWAAPLLRWLADNGTRPVIVSGAPQEILTEHLVHLRLGDLEAHGLTLTVDGAGRYAGGVAGNVGTDAAKQQLIEQLAQSAGPVVLGVGDSTSDLPLLRAARRQLIVGRHARRLLQEFGASAACVPDPAAASADEMIGLVSVLTAS